MAKSALPEINLEEFSNKLLARNKRFIELATLELTYRCNLDCLHCYCNCPGLKDAKDELSLKELCLLMDDIAEQGCLWIAFTGGEPFIRKDFVDIYLYAKKKGFIIVVLTNATLLDKKILDVFKDWPPEEVEISLYGITKQTYESVTGKPGSFEQCMNAIGLLRTHNISIEIKTVVLSRNRHEIKAIGDFAKQIGAKFRYDPLIHSRLDHDSSNSIFRLSAREIAELDSQIDGSDGYFKKEYRACFGGKTDNEKLFTCGAGKHCFSIDPFGRLKTCVFPGRYTYDLRKGSFEEGWNDFIPKIVNRKRKNKSFPCSSCAIRLLCNQCPQWAYLENYDEEKIVDYLCEVNRKRAEKFLLTDFNSGGKNESKEKI